MLIAQCILQFYTIGCTAEAACGCPAGREDPRVGSRFPSRLRSGRVPGRAAGQQGHEDGSRGLSRPSEQPGLGGRLFGGGSEGAPASPLIRRSRHSPPVQGNGKRNLPEFKELRLGQVFLYRCTMVSRVLNSSIQAFPERPDSMYWMFSR